eukprot:Awhi_evm2s3397
MTQVLMVLYPSHRENEPLPERISHSRPVNVDHKCEAAYEDNVPSQFSRDTCLTQDTTVLPTDHEHEIPLDE